MKITERKNGWLRSDILAWLAKRPHANYFELLDGMAWPGIFGVDWLAPGKAFILMTALAIWGAISGWRVAKEAVTFALLWIFVPLLLLQIVSYLATPLFEGQTG